MGENEKLAAIIIGIILLVIALVFAVFGGLHMAMGKTHLISTPIGDLELGKIYEVRAVVREGENFLLFLRAEDQSEDAIKYYQLPSNEVPPDLEVGDGLVKLFSGLERRPNAFNEN